MAKIAQRAPVKTASRSSAPAKTTPASRSNVPAVKQNLPPVDAGTMSSLPAYMRGDIDAGKSRITRDDVETPRLKLIQGLSPELQEFDDLRAGHFFHPAAEYIFDRAFRAVPIYFDKRYVLWNPRESGGGILARADDGVHWSPSSGEFKVKLDKKDGGAQVTWVIRHPTVEKSGLANWGSMNPNDPNSPPAATMMYNFLLAFPDEPGLMPAVLTFQRSSLRFGKRFLTKLRTLRAPIFGTVWEFSPNEETRNNQSFYTINVRGAGLVEDEAAYNAYKDLHHQFAALGLQIKDVETLQNEDADNNSEENDASPAY